MRRPLPILALLVIVSACSARETAPPALIGDWELERGTTAGNPFPIVGGHRITVTFSDDGTVGGVAACNSYGGTYVADGEDVIVGELASTAMACGEPGVMESEVAFLAVFSEPLTYTVSDDELTIRHSAGELTFTRVRPVPAAELIDTQWQLETMIVGEAATSVDGEPSLLLGSDGSVSGSTGCRRFSGEYIFDGDTVLFTTLITSGECPADLADQDGFIVNVLGDGFVTEIEGDQLTATSRGSEGLVYRKDR